MRTDEVMSAYTEYANELSLFGTFEEWAVFSDAKEQQFNDEMEFMREYEDDMMAHRGYF
jgi:hypothetical protein